MDITPYVEGLRRDLVAAADTSTDDVRAAAERLALALDPAARLALMEALSHAAAEITSELPSGSVDVRLHGRELDFVVDVPVAEEKTVVMPAVTAEELEDGALARITLRLPESVKARAEELAAAGGQSLNTWLVAAVRRATSRHVAEPDLDVSSIPVASDPFGRAWPRHGTSRRMTGWV